LDCGGDFPGSLPEQAEAWTDGNRSRTQDERIASEIPFDIIQAFLQGLVFVRFHLHWPATPTETI
jgi:hypothetical protein